MFRLLPALVLISTVATLPQAPNLAAASVRIDTAEALAQIVKRVDPVWPPGAAAAQIGGAVTVDIIVGLTGTVESATALVGAQPLRAAAIAAVKRWTFKPFVRNGKPVRVRVLIPVQFPDPKGDAEHRQRYATRASLLGPRDNRTLRLAGTIPCLCPAAAEITDADAQQMVAAIDPKRRAWLLEAHSLRSAVIVFDGATQTGAGFRAGPISSLVKDGPPLPPGAKGWGYGPMGQRHWLQILPPGIDPSAPQDPARLPWPITVNWDLGTGLPEADAAALARFVHDAAGQSAAPASSPAPLKPVKDWAISEITSERSGFVVELREPGAMHSQFVFVRRSGPAWQFVWVE